MKIDARVLRAGLGGIVVLCAAAALARAFHAADLRVTLGALAHAGRLAPLALLPFLVGMALDAAGMGLLLGTLGRSVPLAKLLPIRIATEALHSTAPAGFVVADTATASLLDTHCGVPLGEGAVLAVSRKWLVMRAHAAYIVCGAACVAALPAVAARLNGGRWVAAGAAASLALVPLTLSMVLGAGFRGQSALSRLQGAMERLPWAALSARVARWRAGAARGDVHLDRVGAARAVTWRASAAFLGCWGVEAMETALVLWLVGGRLDLGLALAVEMGLSLVRSVGNLAPAGLGLQEAGYATLFTAAGVPVDTAAAFVLLKRGKELVWVAAGFALLASMRRSSSEDRSVRGAILTAP